MAEQHRVEGSWRRGWRCVRCGIRWYESDNPRDMERRRIRNVLRWIEGGLRNCPQYLEIDAARAARGEERDG